MGHDWLIKIVYDVDITFKGKRTQVLDFVYFPCLFKFLTKAWGYKAIAIKNLNR